MSVLGRKFADLEKGHIAILEGYPEQGEESKWRVNTSAEIGPGSQRAIIMQAADTSTQWITVALRKSGDTWEIDDFAGFEGEPPKGGGDEAAISIDPQDVELLRIET